MVNYARNKEVASFLWENCYFLQKKGTDYLKGDKLGLRSISGDIVSAIKEKADTEITDLFVESIIRGENEHVFMKAKLAQDAEPVDYEFDLPRKRKYFFI